MKNHCGDSVGFHLEPLCGFRSDFVYAKFLRPKSCYHSTFLLFSPSSVMILSAFLSSFLVFFFFVKDQIKASFQLKEIVVFLN